MTEEQLKRFEEECIGILKDECRTECEVEKFSENFKDLVEDYLVEYSCELGKISAGELIDYYDSNFSQEEAQCISDEETLSAFDMGGENPKGSIIKTTIKKVKSKKDDNITETIKKNIKKEDTPKKNIKKEHILSPKHISDLPNNTTGSKIQIPRLPDDKRFTWFLIHKKIINAICQKNETYSKILKDEKFEVFLFNNFMTWSNVELLDIIPSRRLIKEDEKLEICAYYNYLRTQQRTNKKYDTQNKIDFEYWQASVNLIAEATYIEDENILKATIASLNESFKRMKKSMRDNIEALVFIDENFPREFTYENIIEFCSDKKFEKLKAIFNSKEIDKFEILLVESARQCGIKLNFENTKEAHSYLEKRDKEKQFQLQPRANSEKRRYILEDFYRRFTVYLNEKYQQKFKVKRVKDRFRYLGTLAERWNDLEKLRKSQII